MVTLRKMNALLLAPVIALSLTGCSSSSGSNSAPLNAQDMKRLPESIKNSNMPDEAKKGLAEELRKRELRPGAANGQGK